MCQCEGELDDYRIQAAEYEKEIEQLVEALRFYADPESYFAIGFFPDPPCGDFIEDFDEQELGYKPGKKAREVLERLGYGDD